MTHKTKFVCGGGWIERQRFGRPKLRLWTLLAVAWSAISVPLLSLIWSGETGPAVSWFTILCAALALPQPIFVAFAIYFWRTERPCQWNERVRDPDYDPRCLY